MANPRKFSEKIAMHNQKQAEETAAFDRIMREVSDATIIKVCFYQNQFYSFLAIMGVFAYVYCCNWYIRCIYV